MREQPTIKTSRTELPRVHSKCQQLSGPVVVGLLRAGFGPNELQNSALKGLRWTGGRLLWLDDARGGLHSSNATWSATRAGGGAPVPGKRLSRFVTNVLEYLI